MGNKNEDELLEDYKYAKHRKEYLALMSKFINEDINGEEFERRFVKRWLKNGSETYNAKKLADLEKNVDLKRFRGFGKVLAMVFLDCQFFEPDESLNSGTTEKELRSYVTEAFLKIKNNYS